MAEPILGQALALQSEFRPDTTQVLTRAVDKIGNVTLKKQLAAAKAAETKAKREQDIMASINLKAGKLGVHYVGDAQKLLTQGISEITEATQKGDLAKKVLLEGQYQTALDNLVFENNLLENFKKTKQQGGLIPDEVELGFSMPRAQANEYFKKLLTERPEFRFVFDQTSEGYYKFNPVKQINEAEEYGKIINANKSEYAVQSIKRQDGKDIVSYKIPDARINDLANLLANDKNYVINALINNTKAVNNEVQAALQANPALTKEEAEEIGIKSYFVKNLQSANQDFSVSNTPKPKSGLEMNFGGGYKIGNDVFNPTLSDPAQSLGAYQKAGILSQNYIETFNNQSPEKQQDAIARIRNRVGDLLSISGPNKGGYSLLNEQGDKVYLDNIEFVYVPKSAEGKGGQWMVKGVSKETNKLGKIIENIEFIPINEKTYGNIISIYPKMTSGDIVKMFNQRMKDGNIKNDTFVLRTGSGRRPQSTGKPAPAPKGGNKTVPLSSIKGLVGKAGYEGYTEKELVDYYKSQGYTIN